MPRAVPPVCVARDDGEWAADRRGYHLLGVGMDDDWSAEPRIARKAVAVQALARGRPLDLAEFRLGSGSVRVLNRRRLNFRHAGRVRIGLRRDVATPRAGIADHREHLR